MATRRLETLPQAIRPCPLTAEFKDPVSHCRVCDRDVFDLSSLTREEAAALLSRDEPPCVRFMVREGQPVFQKVARTVAVAALVGSAVYAGAALQPEPVAMQARHIVAAIEETAKAAADAMTTSTPSRGSGANPGQGMDFTIVGGAVSSSSWR